MPRDFLAEKNAATKRVNDFLTAQPGQVNDALAKTKTQIESGRNSALGDQLSSNLSGIGQQYNLGPIQTDTSAVRRGLSSNLNVGQAQQKMGLNSSRINAVYNQALNMAQDAGYNRQAADDFARSHMNQEIQNQNQAWQNQFSRDQNTRQAGMAQDFANQGIALENQYNTPQVDYQSSLMRVLTGLPVQIGTSYLLNRQPGQPYTGQLPQNSGLNSSNPLTSGSAFSTNINPFTGRRQ